jgi:hypothetical protein
MGRVRRVEGGHERRRGPICARRELPCGTDTKGTSTHHIVGLLDLRRDLGELFPAELCVFWGMSAGKKAGGEGGNISIMSGAGGPRCRRPPSALARRSLSPPVSAARPVICRLISVDFWQYSFSYCENSAPSSIAVGGAGRGVRGEEVAAPCVVVCLRLSAPQDAARSRRARRYAAARRRGTLAPRARLDSRGARVCEKARRRRVSTRVLVDNVVS